nr:RNA-directed DNA polymerase, eukaryota, reverse transcriptase zinc-binding domain protein [Tanacetum cinerariifolium]
MSLFKVPSQALKRMETIRSRFFNGVDANEKKMSWVSWNKVLVSKDKGGLGVLRFYAMNRALMLKWVWSFKSDDTSLWARFIKDMHGNDDLLGKLVKSHFPSIWLDIISDLANLKHQGIDLLGLLKKIGNGLDTSFWEDSWKGDIAFKSLYPRIYALETCKKINVASKMAHENLGISLRRIFRSGDELEQFNDMTNSLVGFQLPSMIDRWFWSLSRLGVFSVASIRKLVDDHLLSKGWIFILFFVPSVRNILKHLVTLFACSMASDIFRNIAFWWDVNPPHVASFEEWDLWMSSLNLSSNRKLLLEGVIYTAWWFIWNFPNKLVFGSTSPSKAVLFDDNVARSFQWCKHRGRFKFNWLDWLKTHYLVTM